MTVGNERDPLQIGSILSNANWNEEAALCACKQFNESFLRFVRNQQRRVNYTYLSRLFTHLVAVPINSRKDANRANQRRARDRKTSLLKVDAEGKKSVTTEVHYRNELIHWLIFGDGSSFKKTRYMTQGEAAKQVAEWLLLLRLAIVRTSLKSADKHDRAILEDKIARLASSLGRSYREWDPRQLPNFPRGLTVFGNGPAERALCRF